MDPQNLLVKVIKILDFLKIPLEDIQSVLEFTKDKLDLVYLRKWAYKHNTSGVLEEMTGLI